MVERHSSSKDANVLTDLSVLNFAAWPPAPAGDRVACSIRPRWLACPAGTDLPCHA